MANTHPEDCDDVNNNAVINLMCHEQIDSVEPLLSTSSDNETSNEYQQYPDRDSSLTNLFYKCRECLIDEETESFLEKKGISRTTKFPYALNHLALKEIFKRFWPLSKEKAELIKSTNYYKVLEVNVTRLLTKNLLFRITQRDSEWIHSAKSIINIINNYDAQHRLFLESNHVKMAPICCCVLQRRCIYSMCCFYTWSVDATTHIMNRYTHCCNGYYTQNCAHFESLSRHDYHLSGKKEEKMLAK